MMTAHEPYRKAAGSDTSRRTGRDARWPRCSACCVPALGSIALYTLMRPNEAP